MKRTEQKLEEKVLNLLRETTESNTELGKKVGLCNQTITNIQNNAIKEGILDEKYRRLASGLIQYQKDDAIRLLKNTYDSSSEIGRKLGLSNGTVTNIQNRAIADGILDKKYRRIAGGVIQSQKDEVIDILKGTAYNLDEIRELSGLSQSAIHTIQNESIKNRILDKKYKRSYGGVIQYQKDEVIDMLKGTAYNIDEIKKLFGLSATPITSIQNEAIKNGILDKKYKRLKGGIIQYQKDEVIDMLKGTAYNIDEIEELVGLTVATISKIQNEAIKNGILDEKYQRLHGGVIQYQKDKATEMLRKNEYTISDINEKTKLSVGAVIRIKKQLIESGILDKSYKTINIKHVLDEMLNDYVAGAGK